MIFFSEIQKFKSMWAFEEHVLKYVFSYLSYLDELEVLELDLFLFFQSQ